MSKKFILTPAIIKDATALIKKECDKGKPSLSKIRNAFSSAARFKSWADLISMMETQEPQALPTIEAEGPKKVQVLSWSHDGDCELFYTEEEAMQSILAYGDADKEELKFAFSEGFFEFDDGTIVDINEAFLPSQQKSVVAKADKSDAGEPSESPLIKLYDNEFIQIDTEAWLSSFFKPEEELTRLYQSDNGFLEGYRSLQEGDTTANYENNLRTDFEFDIYIPEFDDAETWMDSEEIYVVVNSQTSPVVYSFFPETAYDFFGSIQIFWTVQDTQGNAVDVDGDSNYRPLSNFEISQSASCFSFDEKNKQATAVYRGEPVTLIPFSRGL